MKDLYPKRRERMENEFLKHNITNTERVSAVNYKKENMNFNWILNNKIIKGKPFQVNYLPKEMQKEHSMKTLSCLFSHLKALRISFENKDEYALILEDDV